MIKTDQAAELWARLVSGRPLEGLGLPTRGGRIDLSGLVAPEASVIHRYFTKFARVKELGNLIIIQGGRWKGLDFSNAQLKSLRFHDSEIEDCIFDGANCYGWRMWGTTISNTSFRSANLRTAALGGVENNRRNTFRDVDFTKADLRQTAHFSAEMVRCTFRDTNLSKVDFNGTVFVSCTFEGELNEVQFYRQAFRGETFPPNEMKDVDLRHARLKYVEFRGLDMDTVLWPEGDEHILIQNYPETLERFMGVLKSRSDAGARGLMASFALMRKWAGPNQRVGVVSKAELIEMGGEEALAEFLSVVGH